MKPAETLDQQVSVRFQVLTSTGYEHVHMKEVELLVRGNITRLSVDVEKH